ncbi:MAG: hybrid sensor histidine kinase/response regulator [bacterium]|nr:hybrid sensor histidine kinase/response regulator [bacterium]
MDKTTSLNILLVEDNPDDAFLLRRTFRNATHLEFRVDFVDRLSDALDQLDKETYDCILLDLSLPDSYGLDTLAKVREAQPDLAILVLTGNADDEASIQAVRMGAQDYLVKGSHDEALLVRAVRYAVARKRQEWELKALTMELSHSNETKDKLLAIIAHDIKNPLNGLLGFLDLASNRAERMTGAELSPMLRDANSAAHHLAELIENLLTWARSQSGRLEHRPQKLALNLEVVERVVEQYESLIHQKGIELEVDVQPDLIAFADWFMVYTILSNFLGNAIKFTSKGGKIRLTGSQTGDKLRLGVEDQGVGMTEATRQHLLQGDLIGSNRGTQGEEGTGLGLLICREFAEKNDGQLGIHSEVGKGSHFWVELPAATK